MREEIVLKPMTPEMYHEFFREYQNDMDLYLDKNEFFEYVYDKFAQIETLIKTRVFTLLCGKVDSA